MKNKVSIIYCAYLVQFAFPTMIFYELSILSLLLSKPVFFEFI